MVRLLSIGRGCPAGREHWKEELAWANSIFGPSCNYEAPESRFADGRQIPAGVLGELTGITEALTEEISWQDGDVVLIDNSRVMHGRRAITGSRRTIVKRAEFRRVRREDQGQLCRTKNTTSGPFAGFSMSS